MITLVVLENCARCRHLQKYLMANGYVYTTVLESVYRDNWRLWKYTIIMDRLAFSGWNGEYPFVLDNGKVYTYEKYCTLCGCDPDLSCVDGSCRID